MILDQIWIDKHSPCQEAIDWGMLQKKHDVKSIIKSLIKEKKWEWAEWTISKSLNPIENTRWAIFSAEQVLPIFEKQYPNDNRPRLAIEAARVVVKNPTKAAWAAARDAAWAANHDKMRTKCILYGLKLVLENK